MKRKTNNNENSVKSDTNGSESRLPLFAFVIKSHFHTFLFSVVFFNARATVTKRHATAEATINKSSSWSEYSSLCSCSFCERARASRAHCQVLFTHFATAFVFHCDLRSSSFYTRTNKRGTSMGTLHVFGAVAHPVARIRCEFLSSHSSGSRACYASAVVWSERYQFHSNRTETSRRARI